MTGLIIGVMLLILRPPAASPDLSDAASLYGRGLYQQVVDLLSDTSAGTPAGRGLWLGKAYLKLHRWDDAIRELESAIHAEPENCQLHLWLGRAYGLKASRVVFFRAIGLAGNVREQFERARSLCPDSLEVRSDLLDFYIQAPAMIGGGQERARAEAREISRISARMGYQARARIAEKGRNWDEALRELEAGINAFPKDPNPPCDLSEFHFHRQSYGEAAAGARRALRLRADYPRARLLLSASEIMTGGNLPEAIAALQGLSRRSLTDEDPPFQDVYYWLGKGLLAAGRRLEAEQALETALRFDPDHGDARKTLQQARSRP